VATLQPAWEYKTGNPTALEATPLVIDGVMYLATPAVRGDLGGWGWQGPKEGGFGRGIRAAEGSSLR
jgi:hypothetical protein